MFTKKHDIKHGTLVQECSKWMDMWNKRKSKSMESENSLIKLKKIGLLQFSKGKSQMQSLSKDYIVNPLYSLMFSGGSYGNFDEDLKTIWYNLCFLGKKVS